MIAQLLNTRSSATRPRSSRRILAIALLLVSINLQSIVATAEQPTAPTADELSEVGRTIEKLGHANYATRVRARERLQRMGLLAFDELQAAQYHADSEIAMAARHLVSNLLVSWSDDSDPKAVREALDEYGAQNDAERQNRMDRLAELPGHQGLAALCRLARFETSLRLSRVAALAIMRPAAPISTEARSLAAQSIREVIGSNDRVAAVWLRTYADDLDAGTYATAAWRDLIRAQRLKMDEGNDPSTTGPAVLELVQVCATRAAGSGLHDEAIRLSIEHIDLIPPRSREVIDASRWAIDNKMHAIVLELKKRHQLLFDKQPILLYGAAEALRGQGDSGAAEALATAALQIEPLPINEAEVSKMSPKVLEEIAQRHREAGRELESRGLFDWAEREYRHIIDSSPIDSPIAALARTQLAEMFAELNRHDDFVAAIEPIIKRSEEDQSFLRRLSSSHQIQIPYLKAAMTFQQGLAEVEKRDFEAARKTLSAALEQDSKNADILIAMYRIDGDKAWKSKVSDLIARLAISFDNEANLLKQQVKPRMRIPDAGEYLARCLNQYAWLISNTEGNFQKALEYSLYSLELDPDSWQQLDTAGRCYFAIGDFENAIRMQRRALSFMPHSPPLKRQLAEFEQAAQDKAAHDNPGQNKAEQTRS